MLIMMQIDKMRRMFLDTGWFLENIYLENYLELVYNNANTEYIVGKTHQHHILPKCYFTMIGIDVDDSDDNIVTLSIKEHCIAHMYLFKCAIGKLKSRLSYVYTFFTSHFNVGNLFENDDSFFEEMEAYRGTIRAIPVQCLETGDVYASSAEVGRAYGAKYAENVATSAKAVDKGISRKAWGLHWIRLYDGVPYSKEDRDRILSSLISIRYTKVYRHSEETKQKMRDSWNDPNRRMSRDELASIMSVRMRGNKYWVGKKLTDIAKCKIGIKNGDRVQNLETGDVFYSAPNAALWCGNGCCGANILSSCDALKSGVSRCAYGYHWIQLSDSVSPLSYEERVNIVCNLKYSKNAHHEVVCVETGEVFSTVAEASAKYHCNVSTHLRGKSKTAGGYHWRFLEPQEKVKK